ncbi:MAG TPA: GGDEF domain-containing protein, partial [Streptosporangiaceae bacterium]|nr:GGDEF domain-containing protein [Streptosporangiaceae bacterium]
LANLRNLAVAEIRAATDGLTGLPNKRAVTDALQRTFAQAATTQAPLALLLLDLDHFKRVNDQRGHPVGDQVLASVGATLRGTLRARDFAGRNGGEEFRHASSPDRLERLADAALYLAKRQGRNRVELAEPAPAGPAANGSASVPAPLTKASHCP